MALEILEGLDVQYDDKVHGQIIDPAEWNANFKKIEDNTNQNAAKLNRNFEYIRTNIAGRDELDQIANGKVDKIEGKGLSDSNFSVDEKEKLSHISPNANNYILPPASVSVLGGIKQGVGVIIGPDGTLSFDPYSNYEGGPGVDTIAREQIMVLNEKVGAAFSVFNYGEFTGGAVPSCGFAYNVFDYGEFTGEAVPSYDGAEQGIIPELPHDRILKDYLARRRIEEISLVLTNVQNGMIDCGAF